MKRIVLAGTSTPIQKVLYQLESFPKLAFIALYTEVDKNPEITQYCQKHEIEIRDINLLKTSEGIEALKALKPDWFFCVNATIIFPPQVLAVPTQGALNMHPGKLPEYAGLHTHQWAIRNGEELFGATLHWMTPEVDTGPIAYTAEFPILSKDTGLSLFMKCLSNGTDLVLKAFQSIQENCEIPKVPQDLTKRHLYRHNDALQGDIHWEWPAVKIVNFVRAADYRPFSCPTYQPTFTHNNTLIIVRKVQLGEPAEGIPGEILSITESDVIVKTAENGSICLQMLELPGQKAKNAAELARELGWQVGQRFNHPLLQSSK